MQEDTMDFNALRAKFQDEEILLMQPRIKPVVPETPQAVLPPQSPTHHLPAGARPSILTAINLDSRTAGAPKVVFKEDKKDGRKPLISPTPKNKEKSNAKPKAGKDKDSKSTKGSKEKLDAEDQDASKPKSGKDKKGLLHFRTKESTELVPTLPPPKGTLRKMVFPGFKKVSKRGSMDMDPILDSPSPDIHSGPAPLVPSGSLPSVGAPAAAHTLPPRTALVPAIPECNTMAALLPPNFIPIPPPKGPSHASLIDNVPARNTAPWQETETPSAVETAPAPPVSASPRSTTPTSVRPATPSSPLLGSVAAPSPAPSGPSTPPPRSGPIAAGAEVEVDRGGEELPTADDAPPLSSSPKMERPASALSSALERAAVKTPGKKTTPADQRILQALEKARRKAASPFTSHLMTPSPEAFPPPGSLVDLPPMDYEDRRNPKAALVNGFESTLQKCLISQPHMENKVCFVSQGMPEEGPDVMPELMVVPPPPPRRVLPDPQVLGPPPLKPTRPPSVNLTPYLPPPLEVNEILTPPESWEQEETSEDLPEFEDTHSPESHSPQSSDWGNEDYSTPNGHNHQNTLPDTINSAYEDYGVPGFREIPKVEQSQDPFDSSARSAQDNRPTSTFQPNDSTVESSGNFHEDVNVSTIKKKVKVEGLKKRKGPLKNPYDESPQPTNEEKSKLGRLGKTDKKAPTEGPDEKEWKKKEKQRLEKEKKEQKEQKEREKKKNDMKRKLNITGQEEAMYQAMVTVTTKGRKNDLPVESGENISIIRTTKCPKGKWLARNNSNTYGYVSVDHVKLDIQEMMQMGRRAATSYPDSSNSVLDGAASTLSNRHSNHYPESTGSFTDDSEEWSGDDEDPLTPTNSAEPFTPQGHIRTHSMPDFGNKELSVVHQHSHSDISTQGPPMQAKHEALHKLATFFQSPKPVVEEPTTRPETPPTEEVNGDMLILPPPELYADPQNGTSL
ncbi:unnamed protein product [Lota lota]